MVHVEGVIGRMPLACKIIIVQRIIQKISMKIHILTKTVIIQYTDEGIMEELFITKQRSTRSTIVMLFLTTHTSLKEVCSSFGCIKYMYKYIYKVHNRSMMELQSEEEEAAEIDECKMFIDSRYISAPEAC